MLASETNARCIFVVKDGAAKANARCIFVVENDEPAIEASARCIFEMKEEQAARCIFVAKDKQAARCIFEVKDEQAVRCIFELTGKTEARCIFIAKDGTPTETRARCIFVAAKDEKSARCIFEVKDEPAARCIFKVKADARCIFEVKAEPAARCIFETEGEAKQGIELEKVSFYHDRLNKWDMSRVKAHVVAKGYFRTDEVDAAEREYKRFLALGCAYKKNAVPVSERVDEFWHAHILFTEDYAAMCDAVLGQFMHHRPEAPDSPPPSESELALYRASFGTPDAKWWGSAGRLLH